MSETIVDKDSRFSFDTTPGSPSQPDYQLTGEVKWIVGNVSDYETVAQPSAVCFVTAHTQLGRPIIGGVYNVSAGPLWLAEPVPWHEIQPAIDKLIAFAKAEFGNDIVGHEVVEIENAHDELGDDTHLIILKLLTQNIGRDRRHQFLEDILERIARSNTKSVRELLTIDVA